MEAKMAGTTSRSVTRAVLSMSLGLMLCSPVLEASALPPADEILQEVQISDSDRRKIREGEIVTWMASEGSDRELALGMALLVKTKTSRTCLRPFGQRLKSNSAMPNEA